MIRHKTKFSPFPAKGTKSRAILAMLFREQGATARELKETAGLSSSNHIWSIMDRARDDCGVDIRLFPDNLSVIHRPGVYKVVGMMKWSGGYKSFVDPVRYADVTPEQPLSQQKDTQ